MRGSYLHREMFCPRAPTPLQLAARSIQAQVVFDILLCSNPPKKLQIDRGGRQTNIHHERCPPPPPRWEKARRSQSRRLGEPRSNQLRQSTAPPNKLNTLVDNTAPACSGVDLYWTTRPAMARRHSRQWSLPQTSPVTSPEC